MMPEPKYEPKADKLAVYLSDEPIGSCHVLVEASSGDAFFLVVKLPDMIRVYCGFNPGSYEYSLMHQFVRDERNITVLTTEPVIAFILEHV